jgi:hypothetical protein
MSTIKSENLPRTKRSMNPNQPCESPFLRASATLLSRLAEAVDGQRNGQPACYVGRFWYEASTEGHRVFGPFPDCDAAEEFRQTLADKDEYGVFGPFYTKKQMLPRDARVVKQVVVHYSDGERICLDGEEFDAVFWSAASLEKFLIPYYVSIGTWKEAAILAKEAAKSSVLGHRLGSIWDKLKLTHATTGEALSESELPAAREPLGIGVYALSPDGSGGETFTAQLVSGGDDRDRRNDR